MKRKILFRATAVILAIASLAATIVVKISEFPAVTTPTDTDLLLLASGATNKNITFANFRNAIGGTSGTAVNNIYVTNISVTNINVQNVTLKGKSIAETYVNGTDVLRPNFKDGAAITFVASATTNITPTLGALTGDVTTSANGLATTIANSAITDAKVSASAAIARSKLAAGTANHVLINDGSGVPSSEATLGAARFPALTGDVTTPGGSLATTIANGAVTYAKMQNISATQKVLGRNTAGAGSAEEVGVSALLDWLGSTRGSILLRGASGWTILPPGTAGYPLTANGAGADPSYQAASGGGGGSVSVNATNVSTPNLKDTSDITWAIGSSTNAQPSFAAQSFNALTYSGTNVTLDCSLGNSYAASYKLSLTNATWLTVPTSIPTTPKFFYLWFQQPSTGLVTVGFTNASFKFPGGVSPTVDTNANAVSLLVFGTGPFTNSLLNYVGIVPQIQ